MLLRCARKFVSSSSFRRFSIVMPPICPYNKWSHLKYVTITCGDFWTSSVINKHFFNRSVFLASFGDRLYLAESTCSSIFFESFIIMVELPLSLVKLTISISPFQGLEYSNFTLLINYILGVFSVYWHIFSASYETFSATPCVKLCMPASVLEIIFSIGWKTRSLMNICQVRKSVAINRYDVHGGRGA